MVVASFRVSAPGSVTLHGFSGVTGLAACLEFAGQGCSPGAVAFNPIFWTISAADLAHHADYDIKVSANLGRGGLSFGWNGPHRVTISNLPMPGGCTAATGYSTGCGVRFRFTSAAGSLTVAAGGDLHLKVRDKATGTVACDVHFAGSATCPLSVGGDWTGYLYPQTSAPGSVTMTVSWP